MGPAPSRLAPDARLTVRVGEVSVPVELFLAEGGPRPAVVVLHELWGVNEDMRRIARRLADHGYHAAVPDLHRGHWALCIWRTLWSLATEGPVVTHVEAVIAALEDREDVGKVGVIGFCLGGGFAGLIGSRPRGDAGDVPRVDAVGIFYGEPPTRARMAARMAPVIAGYGAHDRAFGPKAARLERDCAELGIPHDVKLYPGCGHSYMGDAGHPILSSFVRPIMRVAYDRDAAEDTWERMLGFFGVHLAG